MTSVKFVNNYCVPFEFSNCNAEPSQGRCI